MTEVSSRLSSGAAEGAPGRTVEASSGLFTRHSDSGTGPIAKAHRGSAPCPFGGIIATCEDGGSAC